jgi:hypothetical protein
MALLTSGATLCSYRSGVRDGNCRRASVQGELIDIVLTVVGRTKVVGVLVLPSRFTASLLHIGVIVGQRQRVASEFVRRVYKWRVCRFHPVSPG